MIFLRSAAISVFFLMAVLSVFTARAVSPGVARWPEASAAALEKSGKLQLDVSNLSEGYFMACAPGGSSHRLKLRVEKEGQTLTYDLNGEGEYEVFPLQLGSGTYMVSLYENVGGKKYAQEGGAALDVQLSSEEAPFLYPNQYVGYTQISPLVSKAGELCEGMDEKDAYDAICDFMVSDFVYDFVRALTISPGQLPDVDGSYEKRMGICQDLSAITVGMLRSLGIPSRIVIGYADDNYHAWLQAMIGGEDLFFDPTASLGGISSVKEYSMERYY